MINTMLSSLGADILFIAMVVCLVALVIAWFYSVITKFIVWRTYRKYNKVNTAQNLDAKTNAEYLLKANDVDAKVKKCGFWRGMLGYGMNGYGNSYSPRQKTVFLRKNILDKATITAIGVSSQRVGQAIMDKDGDKQLRKLCNLRAFSVFGPILFFPIIAIFSIIDFALLKTGGMVSIVSVILAFVYFVACFVCLILTIPVEKRANNIALEALKSSGLYTENEILAMKEVLDAYIKSYIADFIYAVVETIWEILKLILKASQSKH